MDKQVSEKKSTDEDVDKQQMKINAIDNLIALYGFLAVLAIHNCLREFVAAPPGASNSNISIFAVDKSLTELGFFLIALIFSFRYFLGDLMFLRNYARKNSKLFLGDVVNVVINALLIAYMSFFVRQPSDLFKIMFIIMCMDIFWMITEYILKRKAERTVPLADTVEMSVSVSGITVFFILIAVYIGESQGFVNSLSNELGTNTISWIFWIMIVNTVADLYFRGPTYIGGSGRLLAVSIKQGQN